MWASSRGEGEGGGIHLCRDVKYAVFVSSWLSVSLRVVSDPSTGGVSVYLLRHFICFSLLSCAVLVFQSVLKLLQKVHSFRMIRIRISDPRSLEPC